MNRRQEYQAFMQSAKWKEIRGLAILRAGYKCQLCSSKNNLRVHHNTYIRFGGGELPNDLCTLCDPCHKAYHDGKTRRIRNGYAKRLKRSKARPKINKNRPIEEVDAEIDLICSSLKIPRKVVRV